MADSIIMAGNTLTDYTIKYATTNTNLYPGQLVCATTSNACATLTTNENIGTFIGSVADVIGDTLTFMASTINVIVNFVAQSVMLSYPFTATTPTITIKVYLRALNYSEKRIKAYLRRRRHRKKLRLDREARQVKIKVDKDFEEGKAVEVPTSQGFKIVL